MNDIEDRAKLFANYIIENNSFDDLKRSALEIVRNEENSGGII